MNEDNEYIRITRNSEGISWTYAIIRGQYESEDAWLKRVVDLHEQLKVHFGDEPGYKKKELK